ncbi:uncharacterized protein LOC115236044 [Formica exsecta]|uniref:uncharacterized protein LOC115236044 n=1 Tax=Formica exsecta TaxID=72781 RepID=UPI0011422D88|nr:uncharacterized protein LOC115236044 [Formica exsecta]
MTIAMLVFTKRFVLSLTARLFDSLGWLAPTITRAKILFQSTWLQGVDWDTPLDEASTRLWQEFQADFQRLEKIRIPRFVPLKEMDAALELHGFADASERAYAAVVYARTNIGKERAEIKLVAANTKVAPIKPVTFPRLELCAATLLIRLAAHVRQTFNEEDIPLHLWSDSTVALGWIPGHPSRWKTFVANRVAEIQTTLPEAKWHHLPGSSNPADCASRGVSPGELVSHPLWWQGPPWLREDKASWMPSLAEALDDLPEERARAHAVAVQQHRLTEPDELTRFSSWIRLLRVTAWCRQWLQRSSEISYGNKGPAGCSRLSHGIRVRRCPPYLDQKSAS